MTKREVIRMDHWKWAKKLSFEMGVKVGDTIWVAGLAALDGEGNVVGGADMRAQSDRVFQSMAEVLAAGGATMEDVVKITAWVTDMANYAAYDAARDAAFPTNRPVSATLLSPALVFPELLVEVEAVAVIGSG